MRISELIIHNVRSFRHQKLSCESLMTFIGPNNAGKSNVLFALSYFFKPSQKLEGEDIYVWRKAEDNEAFVEICFVELSEQDKNTFKKYILADGTMRVRKRTTLGNEESQTSYHGHMEKAQHDWLNPDHAGNYTKREDIPAELYPFVPDKGRITKSMIEEAQLQYINANRHILNFEVSLESGPFMGQKAVAVGLLGDFFLMQAVRDLTDESKIQAQTLFGQLVTAAVREMSVNNPEFIAIKKQLDLLVDKLNKPAEGAEDSRITELAQLEKNIRDELRDWHVDLDIEVIAPEMEKIFQLGTRVFVDDGVRTTAELKGHGLQRALIFAFLKAWTNAIKSSRQQDASIQEETRPRAASQTYIFGIEEPELFLHPHAQRGMFATLRSLAEEPDHQVFICTHSGYFIDMELYKSIVIIDKEASHGSTLLQAEKTLFEGPNREYKKRRMNMCYWFNPDRSELFFAKKVALVEGQTEKSVFPMLAKRLGVWKPDISLIDCGGKANIPLYMEVLNAFKIPYAVIHDEDPITVDSSHKDYNHQKEMFRKNDEIQEMQRADLAHIEILCPKFEIVAGISISQKERFGGPFAAMERFSDENSDIPVRIREIIEAIYSCC